MWRMGGGEFKKKQKYAQFITHKFDANCYYLSQLKNMCLA